MATLTKTIDDPSGDQSGSSASRTRRERIVDAARALAEEQGWEAVTTRRLADAIEYSQPVLYGHFPQGRSQIVTAVALAGFAELAAALSGSALGPEASDVERVRSLVLWGAVHGLVALQRANRYSAEHHAERVETLVRLFAR